MRYVSVCACAFLVWCLSSPVFAQGWGREWFERLSGPGSFQAFELRFPVTCLWHTSAPQKRYWYFETPEGMGQLRDQGQRTSNVGPLAAPDAYRILCVDAGYSFGSNKDREQAGLINIRHVEADILIPFERFPQLTDRAFIEALVGIGAIRFQGDGFQEWRFTLSPRLVVKPLKLIPPKRAGVRANKRYDWRDVLQFPIGAMWITPSIDNEDLHATGFRPFEHGWLKRVNYFLIDLSQVTGLR
jgi:hypothetical protein